MNIVKRIQSIALTLLIAAAATAIPAAAADSGKAAGVVIPVRLTLSETPDEAKKLTYTFVLTAEYDAPLPEHTSITLHPTTRVTDGQFGPIAFERAGTYRYKITKSGAAKEQSAANTYHVTVRYEASGAAEVSAYREDRPNEKSEIAFEDVIPKEPQKTKPSENPQKPKPKHPKPSKNSRTHKHGAKTPRTGDSADALLYGALTLTAGAVLALMLKRKHQ